MIFVDSSFLIAFFNEDDRWHLQSVNMVDKLEKSERVVSNLIVVESITLIGSLMGGKIGKWLYENIKDNYTIINENRFLYDKSIHSFIKYDGTLSITDCVSLEIMKEKGIFEIASFDSDFDKADGIIRLY